ncbi:cytochrome P450 [Pluteus cervinus]|uniref:Cytochrome P450 n=1 Tax=Pluteus cervinus TaxID=181527 RepID=A0ACD3B999_9AGAR|nr:cytochrome P450 [Pluteus cervinus]
MEVLVHFERSPYPATFIAGLLAHLVFNRLEPRSIPAFGSLLCFIPISLGVYLRHHFHNTVLGILWIWALYLIALVCSTIAYRLSSFHPLAKYPGPVMCRITKLWLARIGWTGKQYLYYQELHTLYGDIVRTGPNELSFADISYISPMMGANGMPKSSFWDGGFPDQKQHRSLVGIRNSLDHSRLRKVWSRAFTPDALKYYHTLVDKRCSQLIEALGGSAGDEVDLKTWFHWFSHDVMSDVAYGSGPEMLRNKDIGAIWKLLEEGQPVSIVMLHLPWLGEFFMTIPMFASKLREFKDYCVKRTERRYYSGSPNKDLFYYLMDEAGLEAEKPAYEQVVNDSNLAIVAGSDTVATSLPNVFWLLLQNPSAYIRIQKEVDQLGDKIYDAVELAKAPYLNAVINETLRLHPPVMSGSSRSPWVHSQGHQLGQHYIPVGTTTSIHFYTVQRDSRYFSPSPNDFIPERWLARDVQKELEPQVFSDEAQIVHETSAFLPFSTGPMDCIGKRFAVQELRLVVARLIREFDMEFAEGFDPRVSEDQMKDFFVTSLGSLPVVLQKRL